MGDGRDLYKLHGEIDELGVRMEVYDILANMGEGGDVQKSQIRCIPAAMMFKCWLVCFMYNSSILDQRY